MKMRFFQMSQGFPWVPWWIYNSRAVQFPLRKDPADETKLHGDGRQTNSRSGCRCMAVCWFQFSSLWGDSARTGKHSYVVCAGSSKVAAKSSSVQRTVGKLGSYIMANPSLKLPSLHYVELWLNSVTLQGPVLFYCLLLCQTGGRLWTLD